MATIFELQEQRAGIVEKERAILDAAEQEGRELSAEERQACDQMESDIEQLGKQIDSKQSDERRRAKLASIQEGLRNQRTSATRRSEPTDKPIPDAKGADEPEMLSIHQQLERCISMGADRRDALKEVVKRYNSIEEMGMVRAAARKWIQSGQNTLSMEERAGLQMDVDASGGSLVMPEEFVASLIIGLDESVFMRRIATVLPLTSAESVGVPSFDTDPSAASWTTELSIGTADTTAATGKRRLTPHPLAKLIKVSKTLLRRSAIPVDALIRQRLNHVFAITEEQGFLTGTGSNQPLGVFTASAAGINTDRDVSTDNTTTAITADGLINTKFSLASQYLASANLRWLFHRTAIRNIRKLKDGNGQYLWQAGLGGTPDTILEVPYFMSEYAPSTFTSQQYVGIIGDFMYYWIAESLRLELQRLDELYAATNEVGFVGRLEADGMPVLSEAFARVQLA